MECIHIGSKIITLAIQMHGKVIDLDLSPEKNRIFEDVRLFSKIGEFEDAPTNELSERNILNKINEMFQKNLTQPTLQLLNEYAEYSQPRYRAMLDFYDEQKPKNTVACRQFANIIFDKSLSAADEDSDLLNCFISIFSPRFQGFFVVSIHEKKDENNYELLYPKLKSDKKNLNLLLLDDFTIFAHIFRSELPDLRKYSTTLPDPRLFVDYDKKIVNDKTLTPEEQHARIKKLNEEYFNFLNGWKLTLIGSKIESIKLSVMTDLIKQIVGSNCKINLFDYSCNSISIFVPKIQRTNEKYLLPYDVQDFDDVELGISRHWGGKKSKKTRKKIKKKIKKQQKRKRATKRYKI